MFLDESGNHGLTQIDPLYPIFVLGGLIVEEDYAYGELTKRVQQFKRDLFGREDLILHTADISRNKNGFEKLKNPVFRARFFAELNQLMHDLVYNVIACVIKKNDHFARYGFSALDPYMLSLDVLVERFYFELDFAETTGNIVAEQRSPVLDRQLDIAWLNLKIQGTEFIQATRINQRIESLVALPKAANIAGLQLADLVVSPIGRHVMGKQDHEDWAIIERKFRRRSGSYEGAGLVILPKE
jgi:hypothetical protein